MTEQKEKFLVVIPIFNDWASFLLLLDQMEKTFSGQNIDLQILAIDDGSTTPFPQKDFDSRAFSAISEVHTLLLARNLGHQRAIAVALAHVRKTRETIPLLIMDGDGEDTPEAALSLIQTYQKDSSKIIFARRTKRSEGWAFRICYFFFQKIFAILTGKTIEFGNFSIVPPKSLQRLVVVAELWSHYPSSVLKAKIPYTSIPTSRGKRLSGKSRMNLLSLVLHGLSALAVFGDAVGVRALLGTLALSLISVFAILVVMGIRLFTALAIPGWASYLVSSLTILLIQSVILSLFFIFMILQGRNYSNFIPLRDYSYYILDTKKVYPH